VGAPGGDQPGREPGQGLVAIGTGKVGGRDVAAQLLPTMPGQIVTDLLDGPGDWWCP
jgi:hypothetical protein